MRHWQFIAAALLLLSGCGGLRLDRAPVPHPDDWPTLARNAERDASVPAPLPPPLRRIWAEDVSAGIGSGSPVVVGGILFVATQRGELCAFDPRTGDRIGGSRFGESIEGSPVIDSNLALIPLSNARESLVAFNLVKGIAQWKMKCGDIEVSPLLFGGRLYFGNTQGTFFCIEPRSGKQLWSFAFPSNEKRWGIHSSAVTDGTSIVFGADNGTVYALHPVDGRLLWKHETGAPISSPLLASHGMVFVCNRNGSAIALDGATGTVAWKCTLDAPVFAHTVVLDSILVVGTAAGTLSGLDRRTGHCMWRSALDGPIAAGGAVTGDILYIGTLAKHLYAVRVGDGRILWREEVGGRVRTPPIIAGGRLIVATDDRSVTAFGPGEP